MNKYTRRFAINCIIVMIFLLGESICNIFIENNTIFTLVSFILGLLAILSIDLIYKFHNKPKLNINIEFKDLTDNKDSTKTILTNTDYDFKYYLGFEDDIDNEINTIIHPKEDHKYWAVNVNNTLVGLIYIYNYDKVYKKCALGYGLLPEYRGKGYTVPIVNKFCNYLENEFGIVRIQADIETTNKPCLNTINSSLAELNFKYECTADNYWGSGCSCKLYSRCKQL